MQPFQDVQHPPGADAIAPSAQAFADAGEAASAAIVDPLEDLQADAKFRRDLVRTVTRRALERAAA